MDHKGLHLVKAGEDLLLTVFYLLDGGGLLLNPPFQIAEQLNRFPFQSGHSGSFAVGLRGLVDGGIMPGIGGGVKGYRGRFRWQGSAVVGDEVGMIGG